jgi:hypothetical protein
MNSFEKVKHTLFIKKTYVIYKISTNVGGSLDLCNLEIYLYRFKKKGKQHLEGVF